MKKSILFFFVLSLWNLTLFSQEYTLPLAGIWNFSMDRNDVGVAEKWFKGDNLNDRIALPGSMTENLKGDEITLDTKFTGSIYDSSWYYNPAMEKYRKVGNLKMPFWLTPLKYYVGAAWYSREVNIPATWQGKHIRLFLEQPHFVTQVWLNNTYLGSQNSLNTPHIFNLPLSIKPGKYRLTIRVDNSLKTIDVGANSHSVTDHTQGNWNGIAGRMELQAVSRVFFDDIQIYPDVKNKCAKVKIAVRNLSGETTSGIISVKAESFNSDKYQKIMAQPKKINLLKSDSITYTEISLDFGEGMLTWDEFDPSLYMLTAKISSGKNTYTRQVQFGMREMSIEGKYFLVNGKKILLRGTVENALFPLTGYYPNDIASWERVFRICKSYGLNHMRFHSCSPPEAAFIAADKIGFYLQPEGPSWPNHTTQLGRGLPIDTYLLEETKRMTKFFGNYASFTFLAAGNEPRGAWVPWVTKFVNYWKATDPRRLYTGASVGGSWAWQPANQYHVKAGARGLNWSNTQPESWSDYRERIDTVKAPYVSHETGQWCVYPNFDEIKKYTGVKKAKNFELFRENLADNDMAEMATEFLMASGKLQVLCYKHEIERTLRTPNYAGFQLLSLNDYSGQGTALVGVLDAFWDDKPYINAGKFRRFCNATVPLIRTDRFIYRDADTLKAAVEVAHFGNGSLKNVNVVWRILDKYGLQLQKGKMATMDIPVGSNNNIGWLNIPLNGLVAPSKYNLEITIEGTEFINDWDFWVYPAMVPKVSTEGIYISDTYDEKAQQTLKNGGKVLILAAGKISYGKDVVQYYQPAFWNTSWFKMRPPHTTGVFIRNYHPVFKNFETESWGNLQWWELINRSQTMLLTDFPKGFEPVIQPIDTWFINRKLGSLIEAQVGEGKLIVTTLDLQNNLTNRPVAAQLYYSLLTYMQSNQFRPEVKVQSEQIADLFRKIAPPVSFFTKSSPDELRQGVQ